MRSASHRRLVQRSLENLTPVVAAGEVADTPHQLRIRKPLHRILLRCRIPVVAVVRIPAALLILLARSLVVEPHIQAAVLLISLVRVRPVARILAAALLVLLGRSPAVARTTAALLMLLARSPVAAHIQAVALLMLLARSPVAAHIQAVALLMLLARSPAVARIQAPRPILPPAAARILLLPVTAPVVVRVMRLRRSGRRMRHNAISQALSVMPMPLQITVSTRTLRMVISMPTSEVELLQIV